MKFKVPTFNADECFFISDTHFWHKNIISICKRPFKDIDDMNSQMIENWNKIVPVDAHVFHTGDMVLGGKYAWDYILDALNGQIHLCMGNHDYQNARGIDESKFASIHDQWQIKVLEDDQAITLNHYPLLTWGGVERGVWNLYGHWHTTPEHPLSNTKSTQYDVGVDNNGFKPLSYYEVKEIITKRIEEYKNSIKC